MPQGKRATNLISSPANSSQLKDSQEDALGIDSSHTLPDAILLDSMTWIEQEACHPLVATIGKFSH